MSTIDSVKLNLLFMAKDAHGAFIHILIGLTFVGTNSINIFEFLKKAKIEANFYELSLTYRTRFLLLLLCCAKNFPSTTDSSSSHTDELIVK